MQVDFAREDDKFEIAVPKSFNARKSSDIENSNANALVKKKKENPWRTMECNMN